jgi:hypothetical protein
VSRIWGDRKGHATKTDRILLLSRPAAPPLPPLPYSDKAALFWNEANRQ